MNRFSRFKALPLADEIKRAPALAATMILMLFCLLHSRVDANGVSRSGQSKDQSSERSQPQASQGEPDGAGVSKRDIPDLALLNQDGKRILFYSELLKDKVVAINFVYTTCTAFCTAQGATFAKLQNILGDRLGKSVRLITITTDPETDTPERLKSWGVTFGAKPGWAILTGEKNAVDEILKALTGDIGRKGMHSPIVLIGNANKGAWIRDNGLADPERLAATIEQMTTGKQ